jgi:hypothetical protein
MRRFNCVLLIFVFMCTILIGCQNNEQTNKPAQSGNKTENKMIEAAASGSIDTKGMTKLDEFSHDLDLDNAEEKIELYTDAKRNQNGEMEWDDGQNWLLAVWDGKEAYPLLKQYVQLGSVYFTVSNNGVGEASSITVIVSTGAGLSLKTYVFNKDKGGFEEEDVYTSKDSNYIHSSIPGY